MTGIADSVRLALSLYSGGEDEAALLLLLSLSMELLRELPDGRRGIVRDLLG